MSYITIKSNSSSSVNFEKSRIILSTYEEYRKFIKDQLSKRRNYEGFREKLEKDQEKFLSIFLLNFDKAHFILESLYSLSNRGQIPHDPQILLRSFFLMSAFGEVSITKWVATLKSNAIFPIFCGTTIKKVPGVGTHYDFLKRLENGRYQSKFKNRILPSELRKYRSNIAFPQAVLRKMKPETNVNDKDLIKKYANKTMEEEHEPIINDLEKLLNEILFLVAIEPSCEKNIINDITNLSIAGDGSTVASGANSNGKPTCNCHKKGIYKCNHKRKFSDIDAKWGWDNRVKDFVFGYRFFQLVSADNKHNLPIYINFGSANTHEAYMLIRSIDRFDKQVHTLNSKAQIKEIALDALYDVYGVYNYLHQLYRHITLKCEV